MPETKDSLKARGGGKSLALHPHPDVGWHTDALLGRPRGMEPANNLSEVRNKVA